MKLKIIIITLICIITILCNCKDKKSAVEPSASTTGGSPIQPDINATLGFNILKKLKGIWNGPVTSTSYLGGYPEWIVDFRPNSENQISAKNELDTLNDIFMSFFIAKYNNQYKVAFRNGGSFGGAKRVSYFLADSVSETSTKSFYRFNEIIKGKSRAYTEVIFKDDSLFIKSFTNKFNPQQSPTQHMTWSAKLQDSTSSQITTSYFNFPKKTITKDFSSTFTSQLEAIYFSTSVNPANDPYPEATQPYLGQTTASFSYSTGLTPILSKKVFLIITTKPLFSGFTFNVGNLKFRSRYVILAANDLNFTFNYMHPGAYYYYAFYDNDGNNTANSGDWISIANTTFSLPAQGNSTATTQINFVIP